MASILSRDRELIISNAPCLESSWQRASPTAPHSREREGGENRRGGGGGEQESVCVCEKERERGRERGVCVFVCPYDTYR